MSLGLDLGVSRFRALRRVERRLLGRQTPTAYTAVPRHEAQRRLLAQARIPFCQADDALLVLGPEAPLVADALQSPLIPLLPEGQLPENDPIGRQIAARLVETIVGGATPAGQPATIVLPRGAGPGTPNFEFFTRLLKLQGWTPSPLPASLAVVLAELGGDLFTGIGVTLGAGGSSICLAYHGEPQVLIDIDRGGDWIDRRLIERFGRTLFDATGRQYLDLAGVTRSKLTQRHSIAAPASAEEIALRELYRELLEQLLAQFAAEATPPVIRGLERQRLPIVFHGGVAGVGGFIQVWDECWRAQGIRLPVGTPRMARDDNWSVARGCLIHSELMASGHAQRRSA